MIEHDVDGVVVDHDRREHRLLCVYIRGRNAPCGFEPLALFTRK
jgi:hypothetical protein